MEKKYEYLNVFCNLIRAPNRFLRCKQTATTTNGKNRELRETERERKSESVVKAGCVCNVYACGSFIRFG